MALESIGNVPNRLNDDQRIEKELRVADLREVMQKLRKAEFKKGDWKDLGRELGLHENTLDEINENQSGNIDKCYIKCLTKWLERADQVDDDKYHGRPSFNSLCAALEAIEKGAIAERISAMFGGNSSEGKKPAKSTKPKTDSPTTKTGAGNKGNVTKSDNQYNLINVISNGLVI
uniref:Death domain-containing protein n=1 Tax=Amphimedon queenslandica TaxID=400682 RepID=A0A1X7TQH2_AMPQE